MNDAIINRMVGGLRATIALTIAWLLLAAGCDTSRLAKQQSPQLATPQLETENVFERTLRSTVGVTQDGDIIGTGFLVNRGERQFIWTAAHVVNVECECPAPHKIGAVLRIERQNTLVGRYVMEVEPVVIDVIWDLALLEVKVPVDAPGLTFAWDARTPIGTPLFHVGNMLGSRLEWTVSRGWLSKINRPLEVHWVRPLDQVQFTTMPGSSGGPVLNEQGEVVGILVGGMVSYYGVGYMVPLRDIVEWAGDNDLKFAVYNSKW